MLKRNNINREKSLLEEMSEYGFEYDEKRDIFIDENGQVARILYFKNKPLAYGYIVLRHEYVTFDCHFEDKEQAGKAGEENGLLYIHEKMLFKTIIDGHQGDYRPNDIITVKE